MHFASNYETQGEV